MKIWKKWCYYGVPCEEISNNSITFKQSLSKLFPRKQKKNISWFHCKVIESIGRKIKQQQLCWSRRKKLASSKNAGVSKYLRLFFKVNESRYISLFVVSVSIKKLFWSDDVNIYLFSIFFSIGFPQWKYVKLPHIAYIEITLKTTTCQIPWK